jgi:hypothetical protein
VDRYPLAIALALVLGSARGRAAPSDEEPLTVSLTECPSAPIGASAFLSAIQLELNLRRRPNLSRSDAAPAISVSVDCGGRASISVRIGGTNDEREVRVDDVAVADHPRVLALVVAELVRSGAQKDRPEPDQKQESTGALPAEPGQTSAGEAAATPAPVPRRRGRAAASNRGKPALEAAETHQVASEGPSREGSAGLPRTGGSLAPWVGAWAHVSSGAANAIYGGAAGVDWHRSRVQLEVGLAYAERARGSVSSGLAAARYRHFMPLTEGGRFRLRAALSSAAGVTWATGDSQTPGVVVRRVLIPYADARVSLALELWLAERVTPELEVYSGGAVGLLATNAGQGVLSSGGWLLGTSIGSTF